MGPQEDYIETVVTCEGDFHDPQLQDRLRCFQQRLESLLLEDGKKQLILKKVEPWNSVRVTFSIPRQAALRLKQMAQQGSAILRQIGVLGVQIQGDRLVSLTVATSSNQRAELIISTHEGSGQGPALGTQQTVSVGTSIDPGMPSSSEEQGSPGPNMEVTRKNIEEYLRQGSLFNSIPTPTCAPGLSRAGSTHDNLKTATSADGTAFKVNNIAVDGMPGPSSLSGIAERSAFPSGDSRGPLAVQQGVNVPVSGQRGPRMSVAQHTALHPPKYSINQQKQPHQQLSQLSAQATALPQTAALGYNIMSLPPPPPYPHGHGTGVANNVGRQGKKPPASSPLLINLLQTEPVAGSNNVMAAPGTEKKKKYRRRKEKQTSATGTSDGQVTAQGIPNLPPESDSFSNVVPPQTMPSQEEMSAVLHRRVSPVPLPSPRLGSGFTNSVPMPADLGNGNEGFRDRNPSTASAALVSLAQNQKSASESEQVSDNSIINPYTGHMEPRDSASDLSPVKQDLHKPCKSSHSDSSVNNTSVSAVSVNTQVSLAAAKEDLKLSSSDSLSLGVGSFKPGPTVPTSLREDRPRGFPSSMITSVVSSEHSLVSDCLSGQSPDAGHVRVTTESSTLPNSAAPHIYAQHPFGSSQPLSRAPHVASQHSIHSHTPRPGTSSVNGPVHVTTPPSSLPGSGQLSSETQLQMPRVSLEGGMVDPYHLASHKVRSSVHGNMVHNVSVGHETRMDTVGGQVCGDTSSHQPVTVSGTQPLAHKATPVLEMQTSVASVSTVASQAQSDSLRLLNSSVSLGVAQRLAVESAIPTASTASPAAIKTPSDGEDNNSNHSGISPVSTVAPAPSSLLDANGTKVDNHDSGMGSSSERSDDTTPSEVGDGEFQTSVTTTESSATDSSSNKSAVVVKKTVVNCKKETPSSSDAHTITVGYVQINQHTTDPYSKDTKKYMADASPLIGDKAVMDDPLREVSKLIKSTSSVMPTASQVALASHKDAVVSLPLSTKINSLSYQQVMMKHKAAANNQVTEVHQNGPSSLPHSQPPQHLQGQQVPSSKHASAHHSTAVTVSHHQGHVGVSRPPASTVSNPLPHQQPEKVPVSHSYGGWPLQTGSIPSSLGQDGHLAPSVQSQVIRTNLHPTAVPPGQPPVIASSVPGCVAGEAVAASLHSAAQNSQTTLSSPFHTTLQTAGNSAVLPKSKGHTVVGRDVTNPVTQELHPVEKPTSSEVQKNISQGHASYISSEPASHKTLTLHAVNVTSGHSQHTTSVGTLGLSTTYSSSTSLSSHTQGSSFQGLSSQVPASQSPPSLVSLSQDLASLPSVSQASQSVGSKPAKILPPFPPSSTSAAPKNTATRTLPSTASHPTRSLGNHPVSSAPNMVTSNSLHAVSHDMDSRGQVTCTTVSTSQTSEGDPQHPPPNASSSNSITASGVNITTGLDLGSVASDLDASLGDFALLEDSHGQDLFSAEDLALISEPGLSAYLDGGVRHGTTNGSMSVNTETRAGVNITSMYTKRSSPINVNMLNHIYAAGLPQPRRLTESVQRLVKPLPTPENSLLPGRACKSPSASSRHSSNGSGSPGRANQGGARSPGANLSGTSPARNLVLDKLMPNLSSAVHNCSGSAGSNSQTPQLAHPTFGGGLNCINTTVIPVAPHPLATLQATASNRHKAGNGSAVPASVSVSLSSCVASSFSAPSSSATSFSPTLSSSLTVAPSNVTNSAVSSQAHGNGSSVLKDSVSSRVQQDHLSYSVGGAVSKHPVSSTASFHHAHQSLYVGVSQPDLRQPESSAEGSVMSKVSSPAVSSLPSPVSALSNRVSVRLPQQAVPPDPLCFSVSVCNTSFVENVKSRTNIRSTTCIQPVLTSLSSVHHAPPASFSSPVSSSSSGVAQLQYMPATCSSCTHLQNSTVTTVSSSFDLSTRMTVVTAGHIHPASASSSSVCSSTSAASKLTDFPETPRLTSIGHPVSSVSQQGLAMLACVPQGKTSLDIDSSTKISSEMKPVYTGQTSDPAHKPSVVTSSISDSVSEVTSSGRTVVFPSSTVTSGCHDSGGITTLSTMVGQQPARPSSQTSIPTNERSAPEVPGTAESLTHSAKEAEGDEKVDGEVSRPASIPVSQHSLQDSASNSQCGQSENPHSKPPLLHPAPPLTLPALIPSATPPPPPLTPVLLQDATKKEVTSSPTQISVASGIAGEAEETVSSGVLERSSTVSPFFLVSDHAAVTENRDIQENVACGHSIRDSKGDEAVLKDGPPAQVISNDTGDSEGLAIEVPAGLSLEESSLKTRRLTRKRKSTNSESDSSIEPAPKVASLETSVSSENTVESGKTGPSADLPPKLPKEGKKSHPAEDDKGGKKAEDRLHKKEEEEKGGKKEEEKSAVKSTTHHDRNILEATPEEVAKKMAAAGSKRRVHYTYVLEKVTPGQSYFDTPVLSGRTRSQGTKGSRESSTATGVTTTPTTVSSASQVAGAQLGGIGKDETGETVAAGSKRSTRSLRTKDAGESTQTKRKRAKDHR